MSKQINIGGRIHSTEVGNVSVGANEVFDDTKGKKQNVINSETDAELLRLDQSKQNNLTFDNTPTENSTNPVTSGGVYAANITLHELIEAILVLIPSAASALNQLADKAFVNSSVSTATATFRGTYNVVTDLELAYDATHEQIATKLGQVIATADNNDYAFVQVPVSATSTDIRRTERYKFNGTVWGYEYDLNTSGFTAAQWEAINSGITALLVSKLTNLPTAEVLATMFNAKQNVLTFDASPTALSTNPVYSGGVYAAIKAITDLIPSEATALNQLADKAYVLASILAATPAFKGQFTSLADLLDVASPKAGDIGIVRTKDNDGKDVFTFYQYLNNQWNVYFSLSYHPQTKPATTGTTGDYPYNGMGRVELPMNIVEGVNTLTQSMMPTATGGNTVYVIKYDYTLTGDVTVPANCILDFQGGSLSGAYTLTGNNTDIEAGLVKIFNTNVLFAGTWNVKEAPITWFGANTSNSNNAVEIKKALDFGYLSGAYVFIPEGVYNVTSRIDLSYTTSDPSNSPDIDILNIVGSNNTILKAGGSISTMIRFYECSVRIGFRNIHFHGNGMNIKLIEMTETANNIQAQMVAENCRFTNIEGNDSACIYSFHGSAHLVDCVIQGTGTGGGIGVLCRTTDICLTRCKFAYLIKAIDFQGMAEGTVSAYSCWFQVCLNNIYYEANASIQEPSTFTNCYFVESRNFTKHIAFDNSGANCIIGSLAFINCMFDGGDSNGVLIDLSASGIYGWLTILSCKVWRSAGNEAVNVKTSIGITTDIINSELQLITPSNQKHTLFIDYNGGAGTGTPMASVAGDNIRHCNFPISEGQAWVNKFGVASITANGIILPAGVYIIRAVSFCYAGGNNRLFLKDGNGNLIASSISDYCAPETVIGSDTVPGGSCVAQLYGNIVLSEQKEIVLHHNIQYANSNGLGHGGARSADDTVDWYAYIDVEKIG